jgi:agmatinase
MSFEPNGVGVSNGNIFGFPVDESSADLVILPIPWDVTASYGKGTSCGPQAILEASTQLDFFHPELPKAYETKVYMAPISAAWLEINDKFNQATAEYFRDLETLGEAASMEKHGELVASINEAHQALTTHLQERVEALIKQGKTVAVLGGEHSTSLGLIQALDAHHDSFCILQIDAHADLRKAYQGFVQSHASIMYNALNRCQNLHRLVQVGIRDISEFEVLFAESHPTIRTFFDWNLKSAAFKGTTWDQQCESILQELSENVYISFDIDGLYPYLCPHTGTPVAGGLSLEHISYLLFKLVDSGKFIVGFDLNEVSPGLKGEWDANVGARALWQLVCATELSRRNEC